MPEARLKRAREAGSYDWDIHQETFPADQFVEAVRSALKISLDPADVVKAIQLALTQFDAARKAA